MTFSVRVLLRQHVDRLLGIFSMIFHMLWSNLPFPSSFKTPVVTSLFTQINKSTKTFCLNILDTMIRIILCLTIEVHLLYNIQFNKNILDILIVYYVTFSCSVTIVIYQVISHVWGKDGLVITTNRGYPLLFVHIYSLTVNQVMLATIKISK